MPPKSREPSPAAASRSVETHRRSRPGAAPRGHQSVAFAWYTPGQWARLRELAADAEALDRRFGLWLANAERLEGQLTKKGIAVERVFVDVDNLADWCGSRSRPLDSTARSEYVALVLRSRAAASSRETEVPAPE